MALAVTTRSRLRGLRFAIPMLRASRRIRGQLAETPGCVRFASIMVGPREWWTISVWRSRDEMIEFMRSGAHEDIMWEFSDWLRSFWLMRWRPTADELGAWDGARLGKRREEDEGGKPRRSQEEQEMLESVWEHFPRLRASSAPSGAPSFEYTPQQRRERRRVAGATGVTVRIEVGTLREAFAAWRALRRLRRTLAADSDVLRSTVGTVGSRELYSLVVFRHREAWRRLASTEELAEVFERWPDGAWLMRWEPVNEFGHWDGLRLRREKLGTMVDVPDAARSAAGMKERGSRS